MQGHRGAGPAIDSVWHRLAGLGDTDPVIREFEVHFGYLYFWHVAGHTLLLGNWARRSRALGSPCLGDTREVTGQTSAIIEGGFPYYLLMRIMTGDATDP